MNHELFKIQEQIAYQAVPVCHDPCIKDIFHVIGNSNLPLVQTLISNQILISKQIHLQLRTKVSSSVRTHSLRVSLIDGNLFSPELFDQRAIAKAEDCLKHTPQTVVVQQTSFCPLATPKQTTFAYSRDGAASSSFPRNRGKGTQNQDVLPHSTSPHARANFQAVRTKTSPTGVKVANKPPAPNSRVPQAASTNNDVPIPLQLRHASHFWTFASRMT